MNKNLVLIKYPIRLALETLLMMISFVKMKIGNYEDKNLEIGSGPIRKEGWITLDRCRLSDIYWDLNKNLPFVDNQFNVVYSSHVLEHFSFKELQRLLGELYRVIKPGGIMSVCVPDGKIYIDIYNNKVDAQKFVEYQPAFISQQPMDVLNYLFYMNGEHKHMFDQESLIYHLSCAGFINCKPREFDPKLDSLARHHTSLYVECRKPESK